MEFSEPVGEFNFSTGGEEAGRLTAPPQVTGEDPVNIRFFKIVSELKDLAASKSREKSVEVSGVAVLLAKSRFAVTDQDQPDAHRE